MKGLLPYSSSTNIRGLQTEAGWPEGGNCEIPLLKWPGLHKALLEIYFCLTRIYSYLQVYFNIFAAKT